VTASCLSTPLAPFRPVRSGSHRSVATATAAATSATSATSGTPAVLPATCCRAALARSGARALIVVMALLGTALLLAPEQPVAQADICARHHGSAACRVW